MFETLAFVLYSLGWFICNGYVIETEFEYHYYNRSITCIDGEDCEIKCLHDYGCKYSQITCPDSFTCSIYLSARESGAFTKIYGQESLDILISSTATYSAKNADIYAPKRTLNIICEDHSCYQNTIYESYTDYSGIIVNCNNQYSCRYMQVFADNVKNIDLSCTGSYSCQYLKLYQQSILTSSQLNIKCSAHGCRSATIKSNSETLNINCGYNTATEACYDANIYYSPESEDKNGTIICADDACTETNIYTTEGIFDVSVISNTAQTNLKLHCGINYYHSCNLQPNLVSESNNMLCDDTDFCMSYQYDPLTDFDIIIKEMYSKYNETIQCDNNLKHCSVYCIGRYSCAFSNIICPQNNINATCSIYCGNYGCSSSTITVNNISSLTLETKSDYALQYATVLTSYLQVVEMHCNHGYGCQYMKLTATNINLIDVQCMGTYSCRYSNMMYVSDGDYNTGFLYPVDFDLNCYGLYSCSSSTINSNAGYLNLACNSDSTSTDGCYDVSLYCPESSVLIDENDVNFYCDVLCGKADSCINLDVYSINGWNNVHVSSINDQHPSSATMHCGRAFVQQCNMQGHVNSNEWFCDSSEICSTYRLDLTAMHIMTSKSYEYYNDTIDCELDKDCYIYCTKTSSCQYSVINCGNANCSLFCYGTASCGYSRIIAFDADVLSIYSSGSNAASYSKIYAPNNRLSMVCSNSYSCRYQTLFASSTEQINMHCMSSYSCANQIIYAENTNQTEQKCVGSYSCADSALYQYLSSVSAIGINLDCVGTYSCRRLSIKASIPLSIICENDDSCNALNGFIPKENYFELLCVNDRSCININIYSLKGFINSNVNITSYHDSYANSAKFYCGNGYHKYCELNGLINSNQWICADTVNECYEYAFREDNTDYIVLTYNRKYAYGYIVCDQNKINCDVACNAQYGCWNSKIICPTNSSNSTCSIYCSQSYSCTNLDIYAFNGYPMVDLDCNNNNNYCSGITIYCTPNLNESCIMNNNGECVGFCGNYTYTGTAQTSVNIDFISQHSYPNDSYIVTGGSYQYYNNTIACIGDLNNQCTIRCANTYSCQYAYITFIGNNLSCNLLCQSSSSCDSSQINGNNCLTLNIYGESSSSLSSATINPSNVETLNIFCSGSYACQYLKIYKENDNQNLPSSLQIYQSCTGYRPCRYQFWSVYMTQSTTIECISGYSCANSQYYHYSLHSTRLSCRGSGSCSGSIMKTDASDVLIECELDGACLNMKMFVPESSIINCSDSGGCESLSVYTIAGSNSLNITSTDNNSLVTSNKLYCTETYAESCVLENDGLNRWNCDQNNVCYEFKENRYSIQTEYTYQFYNDDIICDDNRDCHIACKHQYGCQYSEIECPDNYGCYLYCGNRACLSTVIHVGNNGYLNMICYDDYGCENSIVYGTESSTSITMKCTDSYSCQYTQIFAEYINNLNFDCTGSHSCRYGKIYQHSTNSLVSNLNFNCQGYYSCGSILIQTASNANVICNKNQQNDYACNSINLYYTGLVEDGLSIICGNINSCKNNNYYVLTGEYGVNITTFAVTHAETNKLYCCESWISSCILKGQVFYDELICSDRNAVCAENTGACSLTDSSAVFNINQKYEYYNNTINCTDSNDCTIICASQYSCSYASIYCPSDYNCNVYCINQYACDHIQIEAENSNSLTIKSSDTYALEYGTINAPGNQNEFNLMCSSSSCRYIKINAPHSYINSLQCIGSSSCYTMRISAEYASYVNWQCTGSSACAYSMVWHHETAATYFGLSCDGYSACNYLYAIVSAQQVNINCEDSTLTCGNSKIISKSVQSCNVTCKSQTACNSMRIYSVEPSKTLNIFRGDSIFTPNIILQCGLIYQEECKLKANNQTNQLACDVAEICSSYELDYANTDYILYKSDYSNYKQNITCSDTKLNCEAYCFGSYACQYNRVRCPLNSNSVCTLFGGPSGFRNSKIYAESIKSLQLITLGSHAFDSSEFEVESYSLIHDSRNSYGLSSAIMSVASDIIDLDCSYSYGCGSINFISLNKNANVTVYCPSYHSCGYSIFNLQNIKVDAGISCEGSYSCRYMKLYVPKVEELSINCQGSYACQSANVYSSNALTYDSLDCLSTTACRTLSTYCKYPSLNQVCVMEYITDADIWYCSGDICYYDDECRRYKRIRLYPNIGSVLGGDTIIITGPCYNPNINYTCKFGIEEAKLHIINGTHGYCISPPASERGNVLFAVHEDNEWYGMISRYYYNDLFQDYDVDITNLDFINVSNNTNSPEFNSFLMSLITFDYLFTDSEILLQWDAYDEYVRTFEYVNVSLYQITPYYNDGTLFMKRNFLTVLSVNVINTGNHTINLNYSQISELEMSDNWNIFYPNTSRNSHLLTISLDFENIMETVPIKYSISSKIFQHIVIIENVTSPVRRRLILPAVFAAYRAYRIYKLSEKLGVNCLAWKYLDEKIFGKWWEDRGLPQCPDTDPSEIIESDDCEGPWERDGGCNDNTEKGKQGCKDYHTGADNCIRSPGGQQCCYKNGNLCTSPPCAGTADIAPVFGISKDTIKDDITSGNIGGATDQIWKVTKHYFGDVLPYKWCKDATWNDDANIQDYYDRRPQDKTQGNGGSAEEACAPVGGDPHFYSLDLFNYTFNGIGDYYYLYHNDFKIIIRMEQFNNGSVITKLGLDINSIDSLMSFNRSKLAIINTLEIAINEEENILNVYMNGEKMILTPDMYNTKITIGDISMQYDELSVIIRCNFGVFIEIWLRNIDEILQFIEYTVDISAKYQNTVSGLIGNYDNNDKNDLQARNGTILPYTSTIEKIHYEFGLSWLLDASANDNNIFHNLFVSTINPFAYKPLFGFENVDKELRQLATEKCGQEFACMFDVIATEVVEIANTTLNFVQFAKEATETIKIRYNVTEIVTPTPTLEGCDAESMNLYFLVDGNCNLTKSKCVEQQTFISSLLERIKSNDENIEQLFGYIEYGNGMNKLFSLNDEINNDFNSIRQTIRSITNCNNLQGAINHPYYAIQTAINDFRNIDNNYNNIIVIISGCSPYVPTSEIDHTCLLKQEFDDENINLFVVNNNNNNSYECLVNDMNHIVNVNDNWILFDHMINNICSWRGIIPDTFATTMSYEDIEQVSEKNFKQILEKYFIIILVVLIFVCLLCVIFHWIYIYKLKQSNSTKVKYGSVEMNKNDVNSTLSNKYHHANEYSQTVSMQTTNIQGTQPSTNPEMHPIAENDDENDYDL